MLDHGLALSGASATALGFSNLLFAVVARRLGTFLATAAALVLALVVLVAGAAVAGTTPTVDARQTLMLVLAGSLVAVAYLAAIESLRLGPVSITSTIGSASGAATVAAAFVLLGERPSAAQWAGVVVTAAGVVLVSVHVAAGPSGRSGRGPLYGVVAVLLGSVANVLVRDPIRELGPLDAIITQRTVTVVVLGVIVAILVSRRSSIVSAFDPRQASTHAWTPRLVVLVAALGCFDALAFVSFAYALVDTPAWLVGLVSQSGRSLAVIGGIALFAERPSRLQWAGMGILAAGMVILALASR